MENKKKLILGDGLIPIYKPKDLVSKDVSRILQRTYGKLKLGHVGTLDPMAEGVLPIVIGKATRLQDYLLTSEKIYEVEVEFGYQTDSLDTTGSEVATSELPNSSIDLQKVADGLTGKISQVPPIYSAVKYNGKPLYEYARSGREAEVPLEDLKRNIEVYGLEVISSKEKDGKFLSATLRVSASKGTYVRVLAFDFAKAIGSLGTMSALKRTRTAGVSDSECINIRDLEANPELIEKMLIPIPKMPLGLPMLQVDKASSEHLFHGRKAKLSIDQVLESIVKLGADNKKLDSAEYISPVLILDQNAQPLGIGDLQFSLGKNEEKFGTLTKKRGL